MCHFMRVFISILFLLICQMALNAQKSKNQLFSEAKGRLLLPIASYQSVVNNNRHPFHGEGISFTTDTAHEVRAIFEGEVVGIIHAGTDSYSLMTKFGDYYIVYDNLEKPRWEKGSIVKSGQVIGSIFHEPAHSNHDLTILLMKKDKHIPIYNWFNWRNRHITERL